MDTIAMLYELQKKALEDESVRDALLETRKADNPYKVFCEKSRELGFEIYEMELIMAGEEFHAAMKRSTNGGGENSPMLLGEDDFYEMFFSSLEK